MCVCVCEERQSKRYCNDMHIHVCIYINVKFLKNRPCELYCVICLVVLTVHAWTDALWSSYSGRWLLVLSVGRR